MPLRLIGAGAALAALVGCASAASGPEARREVCERQFRAYDTAVRMFSGGGFDENLTLDPNVAREAQRLIEEDCLTRDRDLAGIYTMDALPVRAAPAGSGARIDPIWLHVGIVPGVVTEIQARTFFGELGYQVRGIGAPMLGRRIFVGPFDTEGALAEAASIAAKAGFVAPYPRRFGV
jgi:hypothetical protein